MEMGAKWFLIIFVFASALLLEQIRTQISWNPLRNTSIHSAISFRMIWKHVFFTALSVGVRKYGTGRSMVRCRRPFRLSIGRDRESGDETYLPECNSCFLEGIMIPAVPFRPEPTESRGSTFRSRNWFAKTLSSNIKPRDCGEMKSTLHDWVHWQKEIVEGDLWVFSPALLTVRDNYCELNLRKNDEYKFLW